MSCHLKSPAPAAPAAAAHAAVAAAAAAIVGAGAPSLRLAAWNDLGQMTWLGHLPRIG